MKYEYCKNCWYFRKFIMIIDITKDTEIPLIHKCNSYNSNKLGTSIKRRMVYNCDKHCTEIYKIKICNEKK